MRKKAHNHEGQIGDAPLPYRRAAAVAPTAEISTSAINPSARSTSTTVVASVFDCVAAAVSRMRITSPPTLLGRKLLKNVATRYEPSSVRFFSFTSCACSSNCHRHVLAIRFTTCTPSAATSQGSEALRALVHRRVVSTFEKRNTSNATLTAIFAAITSARRPLDGDADDGKMDSSGMRAFERTRHCTTDSCENYSAHAYFDDRTRAVFRAARHTVQRISSHSRAHGARASGGSRHVSIRPGCRYARASRVSIAAPALCTSGEDRTVVCEAAARRVADLHGDPPGVRRTVRFDPLARRGRRDRRTSVGAVARAAPLRHAL